MSQTAAMVTRVVLVLLALAAIAPASAGSKLAWTRGGVAETAGI